MPEPAVHTLYLVDASPYLFRAHFSLPSSIKSPDGQRTGATYGFASFLLKLIADEKPTHLGVTFDRNLNGSFRNEYYPAYKAQRDEPPPEIVAQIDPSLEVASALGAATFIDDRYEADDLIATLCAKLLPRGHRAVIVTSDKDLAQLVSDQVTLLDFAKGERYTPAEVQEKFGVRPDQITDLLALAGDPVDNIPGVPGIGRKTAADILAAFDHVEDVYARLDELRGSKLRGAQKLAVKLAEHRDIALLSKKLATVAIDAPVHAGLRDPRRRPGPSGKALRSARFQEDPRPRAGHTDTFSVGPGRIYPRSALDAGSLLTCGSTPARSSGPCPGAASTDG